MVNLGAVVAAAGGKGGTLIIVAYVIIFAAMIYFMSYRPQKKEKKRMDEMMSTLAVGDSVLTSSGFYGVVIDITEDTVIVEFGNNKNCRIPRIRVKGWQN